MLQKTRRTFSLASFDQVCAQQQGSDNHEQINSYRRFLTYAVKALPAKQQKTVMLYYLDGLTMAQTAEYLNVSVSTVWRRLHAAKNKLRTVAKICMDAGLLH